MPAARLTGAPLDRVGVPLARIGVAISAEVPAARQVDVVPIAALLVAKAHASAHVAHGVSAAAPFTGVGFAAVPGAAVMQARLIGLELQSHHAIGIDPVGFDLRGKD